jgi:hypothetical protein
MRVEYLEKELKRELFGDGVWMDEPDEAEWIHEESGFPCLALRNQSHGNWCGYFGVPKGHPWHSTEGDDVQTNWGITFSGLYVSPGIVSSYKRRPEDPANLLAVKPEEAFVGYWFLGFDCAHAGDLIPAIRKLMAGRNRSYLPPRLRDQRLKMDTLVPIASQVGRGDCRSGIDVYCDFTYVRREVETLALQAHEQYRGTRRL